MNQQEAISQLNEAYNEMIVASVNLADEQDRQQSIGQEVHFEPGQEMLQIVLEQKWIASLLFLNSMKVRGYQLDHETEISYLERIAQAGEGFSNNKTAY